MLLILKDDHKQHLSILISQTEQVLQDFCKLALDYLKKGPNIKLYQTAAQKLNVQQEVIRNAVEGLVFLLVESCKHKLSDMDFRDSMLTLGFAEGHQGILSAFYEAKRDEIRQMLSQFTLELPHYKNLEWRFEVQVASRALHHQVTPLITMKLSLETKGPDLISTTQNLCLQTDPTNLVHMTQVLEEALAEAKSQHTRRIQRSIK
ncbi:COMM domain-containing protein 2 [Anabrus simplex]|uniref:COMM domain-containing protein 2 n=1 Tax=Anabrus simplex TaxID=316456 RepID=UPI0035A26DDD